MVSLIGHDVLTSEEFLLLVQAERHRPERGLAIDDEWEHDDFGSGRRWRSRTDARRQEAELYSHAGVSIESW